MVLLTGVYKWFKRDDEMTVSICRQTLKPVTAKPNTLHTSSSHPLKGKDVIMKIRHCNNILNGYWQWLATGISMHSYLNGIMCINMVEVAEEDINSGGKKKKQTQTYTRSSGAVNNRLMCSGENKHHVSIFVITWQHNCNKNISLIINARQYTHFN